MSTRITTHLSAIFATVLWLFTTAMVSPPDYSAASMVESNLSFRRFTSIDGLPQMQTETVWQDSEGYIYIGTLSGFVRYDGLTLTPFLRGRRENIVDFEEVDGRVRAMGFVRQWRIRDRNVTEIPVDKKGQLLLNNFNSADLPPGYVLLEDKSETNRVLCKVTSKKMKRITTLPIFDDMTPDRKMFIHTSGIYVPTPDGLFRASHSGTVKLTSKDDIFSLSARGDSLFAFASDGVYRVDETGLTQVCEQQFDAPDYGLMVRQFRDALFVIADSHTIWLYDSRAAAPMQQLATGFNMIKSIFVDKWNRLWAATYQGAYCFFHCNFVNHRLTDPNDIVRALAFCDNHLIMGTLNGTVICDGKAVATDYQNFYAPSAVAIGHKVYLAGNGDVEEVQGSTVRKLGLPDERYLFVSQYKGRLIVGTRNCVLAFDDATLRLDTICGDLKRPWCAVDDGQGSLWISANPGLYRLTGMDDLSRPVIKQVKSTPTSQVITTMASDGKGKVCFAVGDTLFAITDGKVRVVTEALPILKEHEIRAVHLSPKGFIIAAAIDGMMVARLNDRGQASQVHWFDAQNGFTTIEPQMATMAEAPDGTVWLTGLEDMMSFRPQDLLADNQESTIIRQPQPIYMKWWAWLIFATLLSVVIWNITRRFEKRQAQRRMEHLEREKRQKELQLSAVRLKSIPHFHSNVLASIEYFVMNNSVDEAIHYMNLYSDFTNRTLSDIDRPARSIAEEVAYVKTYLELEKLRYSDRLHYNINVAPDVDRNLLLPTMLLHTYCQNAVKHGIAAKNGVGTVEVNISSMGINGVQGVLVAVSDDGVGRSEAAQSRGFSTKQGLKILQQQIEFYNRDTLHKIQQHVTDLTDTQGLPAGTRFEIWIPADFKY